MISVYLLLDLCPSPCPCLSPSPAQTPPRLRPCPASRPSPCPTSPATERDRSVPRACGAAPLGYGIGRKCRPGVRRGTIWRQNWA